MPTCGGNDPLNRSNKEWDITILAITKSVIESGAPKEEWEERTRLGLRIWMGLVTAATKEAN
jgi:hypothetical protein